MVMCIRRVLDLRVIELLAISSATLVTVVRPMHTPISFLCTNADRCRCAQERRESGRERKMEGGRQREKE